MGQLDGKTALVTGAARGQGACEARLFVAEGANVVLCDILDEPGEAVAAELGDRAAYQHLDVRSQEDWERAVSFAEERFGGLHVLVNNAAILSPAAIEEQSLEDYLNVVSVNQVGCWLGMKTALPALRRVGGGSIVNISSVGGMLGVAGVTAYASTKWAMRGMTKCAALEFAKDGIRVNSVHPGSVDTEMLADAGTADLFSIPLGRLAEAEDIAKLVLYLASDASSYVTGSELVIDGGLMSGIPKPA
jgi:3alpha(or 20beta)-hydroxysteroid dehydrogenase